ncbi:hypothetical protein C8F04DRAFT_1257629 [Mycena alexandri]|uniref:Uncharacterized protein n=1 Tax=Mycena alexandri TaxID=1745969 RepID=A0AAD6SZV8_9AGAR|nr:hypothetical protein C8F04DRAFT_1257629 [Mycena alexandri]
MSIPKNKDKPQVAKDLRSFFPVVNRDPGPGIRRALTLRTPPARKKASTAGRTNPLPAPEKSDSSDRLRRLRPHSIAIARGPAKKKIVVATPGEREVRDEALTVEDIWRPGAGPPEVDCHEDDRCQICLHLISHPVFYTCGHGHCYACSRICVVESLILRIYGDWDTSAVTYDWSGLEFPVVGI